MAQQQASETTHEHVRSVINSNATDAESRIDAFETPLKKTSPIGADKLIALDTEDTEKPVYLTLDDINVSVTRTPDALDYALKWDWNCDFPENNFISVIGAELTNTGSNAAGIGHGMAMWGHYTDTSSGNHFGGGVEGKVTGKSGAVSYYGVVGYAQTNVASRSGLTNGFHSQVESYAVDGTTPLAEGITVSYGDVEHVGGALNFTILGEEPVAGKKGIFAYDTGATKYTSISHDGTNGSISTSSGALSLAPANGNYVFVSSGLGLIPLSNNSVTLGADSFAWSGIVTNGQIKIVNPANAAEYTTIDYAGTVTTV